MNKYGEKMETKIRAEEAFVRKYSGDNEWFFDTIETETITLLLSPNKLADADLLTHSLKIAV